MKAENLFLFLISEGSLFQSLDPFTHKDDLYKELSHLGCCRVLLVALRVETYAIQKRRKKDQISNKELDYLEIYK